MEKFVIMSDSSCDLPTSLLKEHDISIIPFYVSFDKENYLRENIDITIQHFYNKLDEKDIFPKTSLPSIQDYINFFKPVLEKGEDILCVNLSSEFSGSFQSAYNASIQLMEEFPERTIKVLDSKRVALGQGLIVLEIAKMRASGYSIQQAFEKANYIIDNSFIIFTIDTLEYLQKGGRVSKSSAFIGDVLNIKPIFSIKDSGLELYSKVRGRKKSLLELIKIFEHFFSDKHIDDYEIAIANSNCVEEALFVENKFKEKFNCSLPYPVFDIGVTIGAHTGKGAVGIGVVKKFDK